jgi:nicotinamidase-related amidase
MNNTLWLLLLLPLLFLGCSGGAESATPEGGLSFHLRSRSKSGNVTTEQVVHWDPKATAIIVCDMWDGHWCKGAARRVAELAVAMNRVLHAARDRGVFIIHAPSTTVGFYKDTEARKRAQDASHVDPVTPLSTAERWGTKWVWPDISQEGDFPIDDSDMGCDDPEKCRVRDAWTRQISTLEIDQARDAITDDGQETLNLLEEHHIKHVILMGVHLNMCVLGRPFGIRQLVRQKKEVVLMRDMTDTMYCSKMRPNVNHFAGTDLVVEHIEKYWCPSLTSADLVGGKVFRFSEDPRH